MMYLDEAAVGMNSSMKKTTTKVHADNMAS